jgi:Rieske Fe-S protein
LEPRSGDDRPHTPPPSLWPVGFAIGIACLLVGLVVSWPAVAVGAAIAALFGFLWARDVMAGGGRPAAPERPEPGAEEPPAASVSRGKFLGGATLGLGAVIGGGVTVPALGFAILPPFFGQHKHEVDVGPLTDFPEGKWVVTTFLQDPKEGEVSRRTAYIRNNGFLTVKGKAEPSYTIISNRCAHLGCPVQVNGPLSNTTKTEMTGKGEEVTLIQAVSVSGFGCPCHGGQYDTEGNRIAGPPVRALDRYEFSIRGGHLFLGKTFSVGKVYGTGAGARIKRFGLAGPGQHVGDWEAWLYPLQPPH